MAGHQHMACKIMYDNVKCGFIGYISYVFDATHCV